MKDAYYYLYFLIVLFWKKTHKRLEPERWYDGGWMCVALLTGQNGLSVYFLAASKVQTQFSYFIVIPIVAMNYYLLARGDRGAEIYEEYSQKFASSNKRLIATLAILYILVTLVLIIFLVLEYRQRHGVNG